ncbi:hypothetical protein LBMAG42_52940 [Deltaproteobacteria bacterium]|nr:hypothetical protein LBMAG42_52940 [Deltaproteobacteria bacterium]
MDCEYDLVMLTLLLLVHALSPASAELIACSVTGLSSSVALGHTSADPRVLEFGPVPALIVGGSMQVITLGDGGTYTLFLEGYRPASFEWVPDLPCNIGVTPGPTPEVRGTLWGVDALPAGTRVWVEGCGSSARVTGGRFAMAATPGRCAMVARASDWQTSWTVNLPSFDVPTEGVVQVKGAFEAPDGGIGVRFAEETPTIQSFAADSAAKAAGLCVGDRIVEVDGWTDVATDAHALLERVSGTPGTVVELLLADGRLVTVERRALNYAFRGGNVGVRVAAARGELVVAEVAGPALRLGVEPGDVVVEFAGVHAEDLNEGLFVGHSRGGGVATLVVRRGGDVVEFDLPREEFELR